MEIKVISQLTALANAIDPSIAKKDFAFSQSLTKEQKALHLIQRAVDGLVSRICALEAKAEAQDALINTLNRKLANANKKISALGATAKNDTKE